MWLRKHLMPMSALPMYTHANKLPYACTPPTRTYTQNKIRNKSILRGPERWLSHVSLHLMFWIWFLVPTWGLGKNSQIISQIILWLCAINTPTKLKCSVTIFNKKEGGTKERKKQQKKPQNFAWILKKSLWFSGNQGLRLY